MNSADQQAARVRAALATVAAIIARDGPGLVPLFERLEAELAALEATESAYARALRMAGRAA